MNILPPVDHPVRSLVHVPTVAGMSPDAARALPDISTAKGLAHRHFKASTRLCAPQLGSALGFYNILVMGKKGQVLLVAFNRKGTYSVRWNFGAPADEGNGPP